MKRAILIFTVFLVLNGLSFGDVINVPEDRERIQTAINSAGEGDTVLVQPGVYRENINFCGKRITVASLFLIDGDETRIDSTIIDGSRNGSVVRFEGSENINSFLSGFTIRNGEYANGGGIRILNAGAKLSHLKVIDNIGVSQGGGGGLYAYRIDTLAILNSVFEGNSSAFGGGIKLHFGNVYIENTVIRNNEATNYGGGLAIFGLHTDVVFNSGVISGNRTDNWGGGLYMLCGSTGKFDNATIIENQADDGGGMFIGGNSQIDFSYGAIANNSADDYGGGVYLSGSNEKHFTNATITQNTADNGEGVNIVEDSRNTFTNCILFENGNTNIFQTGNSSTVIDYSLIEGGEDGIDRQGGSLQYGENNIDEDPLFAGVECQDYSLTGDSPCIDAGDPDSPLDADLTRADMGAFPFLRYSFIYGMVQDAADFDPLPGVNVGLTNGLWTTTDENGYYTVESFSGEYDLTFSLEGYNDSTFAGLELDFNDSLELNLNMLHPEFFAYDDEISVEIERGQELEYQLIIDNDANGVLEWSTEVTVETEEGMNPYELRRSWHVGEMVDNDRLLGSAFDGESFYVSGRNDDEHLIYVMNRDGEITGQFAQPGESRIGMRDLAWDGELLWGVDEGAIFGFSSNGEVIQSWETESNWNAAIVWDEDREMLWISYITSDIFGYARDGELRAEIDRDNLRIYGLAYWKDDPDGCPLYIIHKQAECDYMSLSKTNPDFGEMVFVRDFEEGTDFEGLFITQHYDRYGGWVLMTISNNNRDNGGDQLFVYQLEPNLFYVNVDPLEGILQAGQNEIIDVFFAAVSEEGIRLDLGVYEGSLVFSHNAEGGHAVIPFTLSVTEPFGITDRDNSLPQRFDITGVYPNPFNSVAKIDFEIPERSFINLSIYDLSGRLADRLAQGDYQAGKYSVSLNGYDMPSGLYVVKLEAKDVRLSKKVMLLR